MTNRRYQDELYPQFKKSDSHNEDDLDKEKSHDEDNSEEDPSSSSDDDSQAVTNAIAIATKDMKEMRRMHRLSSSQRKKATREKATRNTNIGMLLTGRTCLPILNGSLIVNEKVQRTFSLKGKKLLKFDTVYKREEEPSISLQTVRSQSRYGVEHSCGYDYLFVFVKYLLSSISALISITQSCLLTRLRSLHIINKCRQISTYYPILSYQPIFTGIVSHNVISFCSMTHNGFSVTLSRIVIGKNSAIIVHRVMFSFWCL